MSLDESFLSIDEDSFEAGRLAAWEAYEPRRPVGDPVGVSDDYQFGWWCGVGAASAWHEGYSAARRGLLSCPYSTDGDDECFREPWLNGYRAAFESDLDREAGKA